MVFKGIRQFLSGAIKQPPNQAVKKAAKTPSSSPVHSPQIQVDDGVSKCLYQLLNLPLSGEGIWVGHLNVSSIPGAIIALAERYLKRLEVVLSYEELTVPEREEFKKKRFAGFESFTEKLADKDDELYKRYSPDEAGYQKYLTENAPHALKSLSKQIPTYIPERDRQEHTYLTGGTGAGKTEAEKWLVHQYLQYSDYATLIILDPQGDFAEQVAHWKENIGGENLVYIDPYLHPDYTPVINPFEVDWQTEDDIEKATIELCAVFEELLQGEDSGLTVNMKTLLLPCISTLIRKKNTGFRDLQVFMDDEQNDYLIKEGLNSPNQHHRYFFKEAFKKKGTSYTRTKQAIYTKLQYFLGLKAFSNVLTGKSTFYLKELLDSRKLIIFNLSKGKLLPDVSSVIGRFIMASLQNLIMKRANIPIEQRVPVHLFVDEAQDFICQSIEPIVTQARKYRLHFTLAQQVYGQGMSENLKRVIKSCTEVKITGKNSYDTLSALKRETGASLEELQNLTRGYFSVSCGSRPPFTVKIPADLVGNKNAMSVQEWERVKQYQLKKYYRHMSQLKQDVRGAAQQVEQNQETDNAEPVFKPKYDLPPS